MQGYSFNLIRGLNQTTLSGIQSVVADSLTAGTSRDQLASKLSNILVPPDGQVTDAIAARAKLIAQTEGIRAFNEGAFSRWQRAGVTEARWQTVNDDHVCKICRRLNGQVARINEGWYSDVTGKRYTSSGHPGCRCPRKPILFSQNEHLTFGLSNGGGA